MEKIFLKPQEPLYKIDSNTGNINFMYLPTTDDQVILENGERLNAILTTVVYYGETDGDLTPEIINADQLGGIDATQYATKEYIEELLGVIENGSY